MQLYIRFLTTTNDAEECGDYVKSWELGVRLLNAEFTVGFWPVGAFAFHNDKTNFANMHKLHNIAQACTATVILSSLCTVKWTGSCCLQSVWTCPFISK